MMSCINSVYCSNRVFPSVGSNVTNGRNLPSLSRSSLRVSCLNNYLLKSHQQKAWPVSNVPKNKRFSPAHAFGGEGKGGNETFSWDSLKKAMGSFKKEPLVGDFFREVQQRGFDGDGGGRNSRGRGGGGGDDSGDPDDGQAGTLEETKEVILAFLGVVFLYIFMIQGEGLTRLARDYIKYLFGGIPTMRLKQTMDSWQKFYDSICWKAVVREDWLEREIVSTETDWHKPELIAKLMESHYRSRRNQDD